MEYLLIGFFAGIIICGAYYQFFLKNRQDENKSEDTETKIELARKEEELKGVVKAKDDMQEQLDEKKAEVIELYKVVDGINEYKTQTQKAINKHDEAVARHTNWWEKLTTNITYQGKFNQEILENLLTSANLVKDRDFFPFCPFSNFNNLNRKNPTISIII